MNEKQIDAALTELGSQRPHIRSKCIEEMTRKVSMLNKERLRRLGQSAEQAPQRKELSVKKPEKGNNRTL